MLVSNITPNHKDTLLQLNADIELAFSKYPNSISEFISYINSTGSKLSKMDNKYYYRSRCVGTIPVELELDEQTLIKELCNIQSKKIDTGLIDYGNVLDVVMLIVKELNLEEKLNELQKGNN